MKENESLLSSTAITGEREVRLTPMDLVGAIFAYSKLSTFPIDRKFLHTFFREMKENPQYGNLLEDFVFSETDIYPFSRKLEATIRKLALARSIDFDNPRFRRFRMTSQARSMEIRIAKSKNPSSEVLELLERIGEEFKKNIKDHEAKEKSKSDVWEFQRRKNRRGTPEFGRLRNNDENVLPPQPASDKLFHQAVKLDREFQENLIKSVLGRTISRGITKE